MYKYCWFPLGLLILSQSFFSCSRKTITFYADSSLFASNEAHRDSPDEIEFLLRKSNSLNGQKIYFKKNEYRTIRAKKPVSITGISPFIQEFYTAYPGDTLKISEHEYSAVYLSGNKKRNTALLCEKILYSSYNDALRKVLGIYRSLDTLPFHGMEDIREGIKQRVRMLASRKRQLLNEVAAKYSISDKYFLNIKRYEIQSDSLMNIYWLSDKFVKPSLERAEWLAICKQFGLDLNNMHIKASAFIYFRESADKLFDLIRAGNKAKNVLRDTADLIQYNNLVKDNFKGAARNYLLSKHFDIAFSKRLNVPEKELKDYFSICRNHVYRVEIKDKIREARDINSIKHTKTGNDILTFNTKQPTTIEEILYKERGNIVLLDFWASWCVPCMEEVPFLKPLENDYKGKKITVIRISLDKEIENWKYTSLKEGFADHNYVFLDFHKSEMLAKYSINTIPRFMLIGKNGEVLVEDAPPPSDHKLRTLIDQYLVN